MKTISFFNRILVPLLFIIILLSTLTGCHLLHHRHGHHGHHNRHYDHDNRYRNDNHRRHSQNGKKEFYKDRHHRY